MAALAGGGGAEHSRTVGYLVVGGIFCFIGAILIGASFINKDLPDDIQTVADIRRVYQNDTRRGSLYAAGVSILSSGLLVFFGFGVTSLVTSHADRQAVAGSPHGIL
jgi:hypothetical protein